MSELQLLCDRLVPVAMEAGAAIMDIHGAGATAQFKGDGSPVTEADRAAEKIILDALTAIAPDITVISEENSESHSLSAPHRFFLVDPLDGTREFLKPEGQGAFTVNIALVENRVPVLGIVYAPALDRMFTGTRDKGAFENGKAIPSAKRSGDELIAVASASHRDPETDEWLQENRIDQTVSIGSSLKFGLVATGEADLYPRFGPTMEWDTAAGDAVLRAAGGTVLHPDGKCFEYGKPNYCNGPFIAKGAFSC